MPLSSLKLSPECLLDKMRIAKLVHERHERIVICDQCAGRFNSYSDGQPLGQTEAVLQYQYWLCMNNPDNHSLDICGYLYQAQAKLGWKQYDNILRTVFGHGTTEYKREYVSPDNIKREQKKAARKRRKQRAQEIRSASDLKSRYKSAITECGRLALRVDELEAHCHQLEAQNKAQENLPSRQYSPCPQRAESQPLPLNIQANHSPPDSIREDESGTYANDYAIGLGRPKSRRILAPEEGRFKLAEALLKGIMCKDCDRKPYIRDSAGRDRSGYPRRRYKCASLSRYRGPNSGPACKSLGCTELIINARSEIGQVRFDRVLQEVYRQHPPAKDRDFPALKLYGARNL